MKQSQIIKNWQPDKVVLESDALRMDQYVGIRKQKRIFSSFQSIFDIANAADTARKNVASHIVLADWNISQYRIMLDIARIMDMVQSKDAVDRSTAITLHVLGQLVTPGLLPPISPELLEEHYESTIQINQHSTYWIYEKRNHMFANTLNHGGKRILGIFGHAHISSIVKKLTALYKHLNQNMAALQEQTDGNMAQEADEKSQGDGLRLGVHETKDGRLKLSVLSPALEKGKKRLPVNICCVVDTSGSMQLSATIKDNAGKEESTGITVLQLVKHSIKTIIHCLDKDDFLSIVAYSSKAKVVTKLMPMTESNKKNTLTELDKLEPDGQTNLWDGLQNGLDMMRQGTKKLNASQKNSAVLLFTDGLPNVTPPKGELGMLEKYIDSYGLPATIHTYGFGYQLDTKLLNALAQTASGTFAFIPDSSMVGTIFVNSLSNICCNVAKDVVLAVEADHKKYEVKVIGNYQHLMTEWGVRLSLGNVMYGQNKDAILQFVAKDDAKANDEENTEEDVTAEVVEGQIDAMSISSGKMYDVGAHSLTYFSLRSGEAVNGAVVMIDDDKNGKSTDMNTFRLKACDVLEECMTEAKIHNLDGAQAKLRALIDEIRKCKNVSKEKYINDLLEDLTGQAFERDGEDTTFHNFKDPGVQNYGSTLFTTLKEMGNKVFIGIEPPKKQVYQSPYASHAHGGGVGGGGGGGLFGMKKGKAKGAKKRNSVVNMNKYYNVGGGCFHGDGAVLMANGGNKKVKELNVGDVVMGGAKIRCVVKHECADNKARLCTYNGLVITPYHPIKVDGKWVFPINVDQGGQQEYHCQFVYNFVLDSGHILTVSGVEACTLGHNFKGSGDDNEVIEHAYLGTTKITDDLMKMKGWTQGSVTLPLGAFKRNVDSQLVEGLVCI